jgi:hypothetical protein
MSFAGPNQTRYDNRNNIRLENPKSMAIVGLSVATMTTIRFIFGIPLAILGVVILGLHFWLFVRGVVVRKPVPSALPVVNVFLLSIGFALLPLPSATLLGLCLAMLDLVLSTCVNLYRR